MGNALKRFLSRLRELRNRHNLTQEQFSELTGISYKYYQALEAGRKQEIRLSTVQRIADVYGVEVYELLSPVLPETKVPIKEAAGSARRKGPKTA